MNLQLDHFPISNTLKNLSGPQLLAFMRGRSLSLGHPIKQSYCLTALRFVLPLDKNGNIFVLHGFHNVSRWMTWLPISLKNAAKCDKWYQLQNHPITESLNAKGAREKLFQVNPVHAVFSVSNKKQILPKLAYGLSELKSTRVLDLD